MGHVEDAFAVLLYLSQILMNIALIEGTNTSFSMKGVYKQFMMGLTVL